MQELRPIALTFKPNISIKGVSGFDAALRKKTLAKMFGSFVGSV